MKKRSVAQIAIDRNWQMTEDRSKYTLESFATEIPACVFLTHIISNSSSEITVLCLGRLLCHPPAQAFSYYARQPGVFAWFWEVASYMRSSLCYVSGRAVCKRLVSEILNRFSKEPVDLFT